VVAQVRGDQLAQRAGLDGGCLPAAGYGLERAAGLAGLLAGFLDAGQRRAEVPSLQRGGDRLGSRLDLAGVPGDFRRDGRVRCGVRPVAGGGAVTCLLAVGVTGRGGLGGAVLSGFAGRVLAAGAVLVSGIWAAGRLALLAGFAAGGRGLGRWLVLPGGAGDRGVTGRAVGVRGPGCADGIGGKAGGAAAAGRQVSGIPGRPPLVRSAAPAISSSASALPAAVRLIPAAVAMPAAVAPSGLAASAAWTAAAGPLGAGPVSGTGAGAGAACAALWAAFRPAVLFFLRAISVTPFLLRRHYLMPGFRVFCTTIALCPA
jgi:hypothetical protein